MVSRSSELWEKIANGRPVFSEEIDKWEKIELSFLQGDDEIPNNLVTDAHLDVNNGPNLGWV
jgi:hypothetical protein